MQLRVVSTSRPLPFHLFDFHHGRDKVYLRAHSRKLVTPRPRILASSTTSTMTTVAPATHKRAASSPPEASDPPTTKVSKATYEAAAEKAPAEEAPTEKVPTTTAPESHKPPTLALSYHTGDIFAAPDHTVLIHACNTQGSWGAGIAAAFRAAYPQAYKCYRSHCLQAHDPATNPVPTGTCLLIPPCETNSKTPKHWIGCLFTSAKYGRAKDKPAVILRNTGPAMKDLLQQVKKAGEGGNGVKEFRMCKINSARFGVPWERTVGVLEGIEIEEGWAEGVEVWSIE